MAPELGCGFDGQRHRGSDVIQREARGGGGANALLRSAKRFEDRQARRSKADAIQIARDLRRRRAVAREHDQARAGSQMRAQQFDRARMQAERGGLLKPPAQPCRGPGKGRGCRQRHGFLGRDRLGQHGAGAVPERIARAQHGHAPAAMRQQFWNRCRERRLPFEGRLAERSGQRQVPAPADDQFGAREPLACRH